MNEDAVARIDVRGDGRASADSPEASRGRGREPLTSAAAPRGCGRPEACSAAGKPPLVNEGSEPVLP